jgi:hypothetical protein
MRTSRTLLAAGFCATAALASTVSGCGSDGNGGSGPNAALYASWNATSFEALGTDFIADGMSLILTLDPAGTYTLDITNDLIDACDPGPDCINGGAFSATATQVTIDPGTQDETVFNYSIVGTTLTLTGSIGGNAVTITLERL